MSEKSRNPVLYLSKTLQSEPEIMALDGISLATWRSHTDTLAWLAIRNAVFSTASGRGRAWSEADFQREFLDKQVWNPHGMWFARAAFEPTADQAESVVGAVSLSLAPHDPRTGRVQWLMVLPQWRRRGVASLLLSTLECAAWRANLRALTLETLASWEEASAFYRARGYREG